MAGNKRWTDRDVKYVRENIEHQPVADIAAALRRSVAAVKQVVRKQRMQKGTISEKCNLLLLLLKARFPHVEDFSPSRFFYEQTGITPRRYWQLYRGENSIRILEYAAIADYFGITIREAMETRQLRLFEDNEPITE